MQKQYKQCFHIQVSQQIYRNYIFSLAHLIITGEVFLN